MKSNSLIKQVSLISGYHFYQTPFKSSLTILLIFVIWWMKE